MNARVQTASSCTSNQQNSFDKLQQRTCSTNVSLLDTASSFTKSLPPVVTASSWGIHDLNTGEILWEKNSEEQREMASLTKTMTCLVSSQLLTRFNEDPEKLTFTVNRVAARIGGTHSGLRENEVVRVIDLLYGLMLPSGNDCALVLAHEFGNMMIRSKRGKAAEKEMMDPIVFFLKEMNKLALKLGMRATCFTNPHGLSEKGNKSTVSDLGKLAYHALQVPLIEKIVSTQSYEAQVTDSRGNTRNLCWKNTNKLLEKGFLGLKTGTTPTAGLCLSCVLKSGDDGVIVTILNARSEAHRWAESEKLAIWALGTISSVKGKMKCFSDATKAKITAKLIAGISKNL